MQTKKIKVLLVPRFENGNLEDDTVGEAQLFYRKYFRQAEKVEVRGCPNPLYVQDDFAMMVVGEGKANSAVSLALVLADPRFDFSEAYIIAVGCAGSAVQDTVMGDVFVISATADGEMGHIADIRDMKESEATETWYYDSSFDGISHFRLNDTLVEKVYQLTKALPLRTTEKTMAHLGKEFGYAEWTQRNPRVLKGTTVTSDNYWKGKYGEANARKIVQTYACPDLYVCSEMEDNATSLVAARFGMLDRLIILRVSVNTDVFMHGATPETLWDGQFEKSINNIADNEEESADIFLPAMENLCDVGSAIIDAIRNGSLS